MTAEHNDATQAFLASLPELKSGEKLCFLCHPKVRCFNACCSDLTMPLTPYDVLRLRQHLHMRSEEFIATHATVTAYPDTGYPLLHLRMDDSPLKRCPFVSDAGCTVYPNRSSACRTYPLGRATTEGEHGEVVERFFIVQEEHCLGFQEATAWTSATWLQDQGLTPYIASNDRYMLLMARQRRTGTMLGSKHATMCLLAFYQLDRFRDFIDNVKLLSRLEVDAEREALIHSDDEACLEFAFDWVALVLYGDTSGVRMKASL